MGNHNGVVQSSCWTHQGEKREAFVGLNRGAPLQTMEDVVCFFHTLVCTFSRSSLSFLFTSFSFLFSQRSPSSSCHFQHLIDRPEQMSFSLSTGCTATGTLHQIPSITVIYASFPLPAYAIIQKLKTFNLSTRPLWMVKTRYQTKMDIVFIQFVLLLSPNRPCGRHFFPCNQFRNSFSLSQSSSLCVYRLIANEKFCFRSRRYVSQTEELNQIIWRAIRTAAAFLFFLYVPPAIPNTKAAWHYLIKVIVGAPTGRAHYGA